MSKYFTEAEEICKCCGELPENGMSSLLLELLDQLREKVAEPIHVTCMYRCPKHNAEVGGGTNSRHLYGRAADIYCDGVSMDELANMATDIGFGGVERNDLYEYVHVDTRQEGKLYLKTKNCWI